MEDFWSYIKRRKKCNPN